MILKGFILVPEADLALIQQELIEHCKLTKQEKGCLVFEVTPDLNNPCKFNVYEEFISPQAFETHQLRVVNSTWGKVTKNVSRHYENQ